MVQSETNRSERSRWIALRRTDSETRSVDSPCQRSGNRSKTQVAPPQPCSGHTVRRHSLGDENRSKARTRNFPSATRKAKTTIKVECPLLRFPQRLSECGPMLVPGGKNLCIRARQQSQRPTTRLRLCRRIPRQSPGSTVSNLPSQC